MGANLAYRIWDDADDITLWAKWQTAVKASEYEEGHSYSGEIGMFGQMSIVWQPTQPNLKAAEALLEKHEKWEAPWGIRFYANEPASPADKEKAAQLKAEAEKVYNEWKTLLFVEISTLKQAEFVTCKNGCKSRFPPKFADEFGCCPLCRQSLLGVRVSNKLAKLKEKQDKLNEQANELLKGKPGKKLRVVIGGMVAC